MILTYTYNVDRLATEWSRSSARKYARGVMQLFTEYVKISPLSACVGGMSELSHQRFFVAIPWGLVPCSSLRDMWPAERQGSSYKCCTKNSARLTSANSVAWVEIDRLSGGGIFRAGGQLAAAAS